MDGEVRQWTGSLARSGFDVHGGRRKRTHHPLHTLTQQQQPPAPQQPPPSSPRQEEGGCPPQQDNLPLQSALSDHLRDAQAAIRDPAGLQAYAATLQAVLQRALKDHVLSRSAP
jgi:hypothetical protein